MLNGNAVVAISFKQEDQPEARKIDQVQAEQADRSERRRIVLR